MLAAGLVRAYLDFFTSWVKHIDFCCFKGMTYAALTLCFKLISFFCFDMSQRRQMTGSVMLKNLWVYNTPLKQQNRCVWPQDGLMCWSFVAHVMMWPPWSATIEAWMFLSWLVHVSSSSCNDILNSPCVDSSLSDGCTSSLYQFESDLRSAFTF